MTYSYKDTVSKEHPEPILNENGKDQRFNNNPKGCQVEKGERAISIEKYGRGGRKLKGTPKQIKAQKLFLDMVQGKPGSPKTWGEIMKKAGYANSTRPYHLLKSDCFQELMQVMPDTEIAMKWFQWALDDDPDVRGHALRAGENVMKLKSRFPDKKISVKGVERKISDLFVDAEEAQIDEKES